MNQDVEPGTGGAEFARECAHRAEVFKIGEAITDERAARRRDDLPLRPLRPATVTRQEEHGRTLAGQCDCGGVADAGGGTGDQHDPPGGGCRRGGELGQQPGSYGQPDPGEAGDHTGLR
jgi:hypothetical protein